MTCTSCGRDDLDEAARFCPSCGAAQAGTEAPEAPAAAPPATTIDVRQEAGTVAGGRVTGVELGQVAGDVTVNEAPGVVQGDLVQGDQHVHGGVVGGDRIEATIGNVGAGAQVAVGHHVAQSGAGGPAPLSAADRTALRIRAAALRDALSAADLAEGRRLVAAEFVGQLEAECLRADGPPDASTLKVAGEWLAANAPALQPALAALFGAPAGARMLAAAGEPAASWAAGRFGG